MRRKVLLAPTDAMRACVALLCVASACLALALAAAEPASALEPSGPEWWTGEEVLPSNLPPEGPQGHPGQGTIIALASNLGDEPINTSGGHTVLIGDQLPAQLTPTAISGGAKHGTVSCVLATLQCSFSGVLYPYERLTVAITVQVHEPAGTVTTLPNTVSAEGGGAPRAASSTHNVQISSTATPFGVQEGYEMAPYNADGTPATLAGSHPFELTSTVIMNQTGATNEREPAMLPRTFRLRLPLGLVGDAQATEQCSSSNFVAHAPLSEIDLCPPSSVVGIVSATVDEPEIAKVKTVTAPLFNLVPSEGEPARFGFNPLGKVPVVIDTSVDPRDDYDVIASVKNTTEFAGLLSSQVTVWGVPGDQRHSASRGWECVDDGYHYEKGEVSTPCPSSTDLPQTPLLTLPTSCPADPALEPLSTSMQAESWPEPGHTPESIESAYLWTGPLGEPLGFGGCEELPFEPRLEVAPATAQTPAVRSASTPTGLSVTVKLPQTGLLEAEGRAESDVRSTTVTLPAGVQLNPSAANGLQACPASPSGGYEGIGFEGFGKFLGGERELRAETAVFSPMFRFVEEGGLAPSCPAASKLGTVRIKTPLLPRELEGAVYLAEPAPNGEAGKNPFDSLIALYLVAEDHEAGVLAKLAGKGELNQETGQVTTTFANTPQLPFEELKLELFGGQRASLSTPARCGSYGVSSVFDGWSGAVAEPQSEPFTVGSGPAGGPCPSGALAFSPGFLAQAGTAQAGAFTPFEVQIERPDGQQALSGVTVGLPAGAAAMLSEVTPCQEPPPGVEWACGEDSLIGHSTAESGLGREPVSLRGEVFLTTGYDGAPFGLLVRTLAQAGPFDLGYVNVRSRINVNPETAAVTITTDAGPHGDALITMLKGIPVQLKRLLVRVDRPDFEFNPTSCDPMSITGSLSGSEGASAGVSSRFQVGGCEELPFHPVLTASAGGHADKADGTSFDVKITSQGLGVANVKKVELQIPAQLPSRQSTLNQACLAAVFQADPASCPEGSLIGYATVHTPVLKSPLTGPAYLVSYGNVKFPDVEFVLQGEGIVLVLDGHTDIKAGVTYSKFETAPDAPFTSFETTLPAGPHGILTGYAGEKEPYELCATKLAMPTTITAQDGAVIEQDTAVTATGCNGVLAKKTAKPTRAQQLAKALASCRKRYRHNKPKRAACEKTARKSYAPSKKKAARKASATHRRA